MEFSNICGFIAICGALLIIISIREKELSSILSTIIYITIMVYAISHVESIILFLRNNINFDIKTKYISELLHITGITLLGATASSICESTGQKNLSKTLDLLTVLKVLSVAVPIIFALFNEFSKLFGE